jgi:hypothetical protein
MTSYRTFAPAVVVAAALLVVASSAPATAGSKPAPIDAFAKRVAGSYLVVVTVTVPPGLEITIPLLATLGADGTISSEDASDYGAGAPGFESDNRGAWRRSGRREVTFHSVGFSFDEFGVLSGSGRLHGTMRFNRSFSGFEGEGEHDFFGPMEDPLAPTEPYPSLAWTATARRIPASLD